MRLKIASACALLALLSISLLPAHADTTTFFPAVELLCRKLPTNSGQNCSQNTEPDVKLAPDGNAYVSAIIGVPGGTNFWRRAPGDTTFRFSGMPEYVTRLSDRGYAPGGGDTAVAIATEKNEAGNYNIYVATLYAAGVTVATSKDNAATWSLNVISAPITADRQWLVARGASTVWLAYQDFGRGSLPVVSRSDDAGFTFGPPVNAYDPNYEPIGALTRSRFGSLTIDPVSGNLYWPFSGPADLFESAQGAVPQNPFEIIRHVIYMNVSTDGGTTWKTETVHAEPPTTRVDAVFPWMTVDAAGTRYVVYSTTKGVFMVWSKDLGPWSPARQVSEAPVASTVLPTIIGGRADTVDIAFLGTDSADVEATTAQWHVYFVQSTDATAPDAHFTQTEASGGPIHVGGVCLRGLGCDLPAPAGSPGDRSMSEILTIALDADGFALITGPYDYFGGKAKGATQSFMIKQSAGVRGFDSELPAIGLTKEPK
jgi:hypothetical protein